MVRRYVLALSVLGIAFIVAAGSAQAGWGHRSETSQPGSSMMSEPATPAPEGSVESSEPSREGVESSEYQREEALETGRLPDIGWTETDRSRVDVVGGIPYREGIDSGP